MSAKKQFLVVHDYGMGGLWALIQARSKEDILSRFEDIELVDPCPVWMSDGRLGTLECFDIDHEPPAWLAMLKKPTG
jgi:hypothetical protein